MCDNKNEKKKKRKVRKSIENENPFFIYCRDDHGFSPLHWCAKEGHLKLVEMFLSRGARVNATNMGDDIPLHLAAAHGHLEVVQLVCYQFFFFCCCALYNLRFCSLFVIDLM